MHTKLLPTLVLGFAIGIVGFAGFAGCGGSSGGTSSSGGSTSTGGTVATGGKASGGSTGGAATGGAATGGSATGGSANGGTASGGTASGGTASGGKATGGTGTGGTAGSAGSTSAGGSTGNGGSAAGGSTGTGIDGGAGNGGAAKPSAGCGKTDGAKTLTTGGTSVEKALATSTRLKVTSGGKSRDVIVDIPADYDPTHPYRLIFSWRQMGGSDTGNANGLHPAGDGPNFDAKSYAYFGLLREATNANQPAIFVAPDTDPIGGNWDWAKDSVYFDDLLALVTTNLCIDESRVFTTGFSFGAMMSYALSVGRATKLRGAVTMAPANYNFTQPTNNNVPLAYMSTTGMSDGTCPWGDDKQGGKACVLQHAKDNGCTIPATIPETTNGSKKYVCYDFEGCKAGYPVKVCRFDGGHTPSAVDDGTSNGDDGLKAFVPPLAWKFISQF